MKRRPLIVQNDGSIYVLEELDSDYYVEAKLNRFASFVKAPEHIHTYKLDEYSLWSVAALGEKADDIISFLEVNAKNSIPEDVQNYIRNEIKEFWTVDFKYTSSDTVLIEATSHEVLDIIIRKVKEQNEKEGNKKIIIDRQKGLSLVVSRKDSDFLKDILLDTYIIINEIVEGINENLFEVDVGLYDYQNEAVNAFLNENKIMNKHGVIIMPPGCGKTLVGLKIIENIRLRTLILVENELSFNVWKDEIESRTNLSSEAKEEIKYNTLNSNISIFTYLKAQEVDTFDILSKEKWGLIIYDDAHKLPADGSRVLAFIPSRYKLAMSSIIERQDNNEYIIYKAIGPKIYNLTLKEAEAKNIQIKVKCYEFKLPYKPWNSIKSDSRKLMLTKARNLYKISAYNTISNKHNKTILASTFREIGDKFKEIITDALQIDGRVKKSRNEIIEKYNNRNSGILIISDLLETSHLEGIDTIISISYNGKSTREEYLRIGRLKSSNMKDTSKPGYYYAFVSKDTIEEEKYRIRRQEMVKRGYRFEILEMDESGQVKSYECQRTFD